MSRFTKPAALAAAVPVPNHLRRLAHCRKADPGSGKSAMRRNCPLDLPAGPSHHVTLQQLLFHQNLKERRRSTISALILAASFLVVFANPVFAHSYLESASPPTNSTVTRTPNEVTIAFTEAIEPQFSTIEVTASNAQRVDDGTVHLVAGDAKRLAVGLQPLPPATYTVVWRVTSVDTHKTDGSYHFTVAAADASGISVEHVWARASAGNATAGAAYLTVTDSGLPDRLVGANTPIAAKAELHETINDSGVMKMRPVTAIALEPGKPVTFMPGGYHVMLMGLKHPLKAGDSFPLTLSFEHAQPITVTAHVEAVGGAAMDHDHGGMGGMPGMSGQMGNKP